MGYPQRDASRTPARLSVDVSFRETPLGSAENGSRNPPRRTPPHSRVSEEPPARPGTTEWPSEGAIPAEPDAKELIKPKGRSGERRGLISQAAQQPFIPRRR